MTTSSDQDTLPHLPETEGAAESEIHAVWPNTRYLPAKTRAAIDALVREVPAMMA